MLGLTYVLVQAQFRFHCYPYHRHATEKVGRDEHRHCMVQPEAIEVGRVTNIHPETERVKAAESWRGAVEKYRVMGQVEFAQRPVLMNWQSARTLPGEVKGPGYTAGGTAALKD